MSFGWAEIFPVETIEHLNGLAANHNFPELIHILTILEQDLTTAFKSLHEKNDQISKDIGELKRQQKLIQIGENNEKKMEQLVQTITQRFPEIFSDVANLIVFVSRVQEEVLQSSHLHGCGLNLSSKIQDILSKLQQVRSELISNALIVKKQPEPVLIKGEPFETEVCLLFTPKVPSAQVRCRIIPEQDVKSALLSNTVHSQFDRIVHNDDSFNNKERLLDENDGVLASRHDQEKEQRLFSFKIYEQLDSVEDNNERPLAEEWDATMTTEHKWVILYEIAESADLRELIGCDDSVWTISLPIALIPDSNQLLDAHGAIVWDRAFGSQEEVEWSELSELLRRLFANLIRSNERPLERPLNDSDLEYLRNKLNSGTDSCSYTLFAKAEVHSPDGNKYSFWNYFISVCKVIRRTLLNYWNRGLIMGFISVEESECKLRQSTEPAFLLRFSDETPGSLDFVCSRKSSNGLELETECIQLKEEKTLADAVRDSDKLQNIQYFCYKGCGLRNKQEILDLDSNKEALINSPVEKRNGDTQINPVTVIDGAIYDKEFQLE
uniref:SH2 domain-containing protein n=1 Tax=Plectus sambesii TaxID=2011161 RepID=A0A914X3E2_9BILA